MLDWISDVAGFMDRPSISRAIVMATLGGIMFTQWVKFQIPDDVADKRKSRYVRLISTIISTGLCYVLWPLGDDWKISLSISFVVGISIPTIYWIGIKALYHFFPWTEDIISARPGEGNETTKP